MPKYEFVAVDFDGTLCADAFPEVGEPKALVIDYVKRLAAEGPKIILYTSRENGTRKLLDEAVAFCKAQEIPLYAVNENPVNPHAAEYGLTPADGRKVYADLYIDDKAVNPFAIEASGAAANIAKNIMPYMQALADIYRCVQEVSTGLQRRNARNEAEKGCCPMQQRKAIYSF